MPPGPWIARARVAGPARCRPRCSTTLRSTWGPCSRSTAMARPRRLRGSWPSCPPATRSTRRYDAVLLRLAAADVAVRRPIPRTIEELHLQEPLVFFGVVGQLDPNRGQPATRRVRRHRSPGPAAADAASAGPAGGVGAPPQPRPATSPRRRRAVHRTHAAAAREIGGGGGPARPGGCRRGRARHG